MELPELGKKCALVSCKQLDFLPFQCAHCQLVFCKEHYVPDKHDCTSFSNVVSEISEAVKHYCCSHGECKSLSPVEMLCPKCRNHFCLQHRHHGCLDKDQNTRDKEKEKWETPKKQFELAKAEANREVDASLNRAKKKDNKTAFKVQLMRLKGKAVGSKGIPVMDRVYFLVHPPRITDKKSKPVFVAKQWSLGRVIDSIADSCDIPNRNNETTAKKLRLFHQQDGSIVCTEMEKQLEQILIDGAVIDGETLILEYVTDIESSCQIEDFEHYKD